MTLRRRVAAFASVLPLALGVAWACAFDDALREYLSTNFWLPFAKSGWDFAISAPATTSPYAGMTRAAGASPLERLRAAYQGIAQGRYDAALLQKAVAEARADGALGAAEREEVDLIDAKIDLRAGSREIPAPLERARVKLEQFLRGARTPAWRSEARGWLAHIHYLNGAQTLAGKIYLDELQRRDSNLSRQTLTNSLRMTYGYDGGRKLLDDLEAYFDTPYHAAFAISLATNPKWNRVRYESEHEPPPVVEAAPPYERIKALLLRHASLFQAKRGAELLANLGMRTALRAGDPKAALQIAARVPRGAAVRRDPDFLWMLGSARFLTRNYTGAEGPLLALFESKAAGGRLRAAAAYGLCGVYRKTARPVEQIRMALWLRAESGADGWASAPNRIEDLTLYWASSGFDLGLLLDVEAPESALREFLEKYPHARRLRLVQYALAVRLARAERYAESAELYASIGARPRAERMRRLAELQAEAEKQGSPESQRLEARLQMAELLARHSCGVYFNDSLWGGLQRYAMFANRENRLTRQDRNALIADERRLKDEQDEYWRAYLLLRDIVRQAGNNSLGRRSAQLALRCLRRISPDRFGRQEEIRTADIRLSLWLRRPERGLAIK